MSFISIFSVFLFPFTISSYTSILPASQLQTQTANDDKLVIAHFVIKIDKKSSLADGF